MQSIVYTLMFPASPTSCDTAVELQAGYVLERIVLGVVDK